MNIGKVIKSNKQDDDYNVLSDEEVHESKWNPKVLYITEYHSHQTKAQTDWLQHEDQRDQARRGIRVEVPEKEKIEEKR